ncbi:MAG: lamin tail domain-containing protein [Myxococcota bacterium]
MLVALAAPALAAVLLNEVVYNPDSADDGNEWIELCATTSTDLTGYTIEVATSGTWSEAYAFTSGSMSAGDYLLVGAGSSTHPGAFDPNLGNVSSDTDGVRLKNASGEVVDTLLYGSPNDDALTDDAGGTTSLAPEVGEGESLARWPDCADTDAAATDWAEYTSPSPGAENPEPGGGGDDTGPPAGEADCTGAADVKLNEFCAASNVEYVELYNAGSAEVALEGWVIQWGTSSINKDEAIGAFTLAPGAWFVVGSGGSYQDQETRLDLGNSSGAIQLACNDVVYDTVVYGSSNSGGFAEDSGETASDLAEEPDVAGVATSRGTDGLDTDVSGDDFCLGEQTPGAANPYCAAPVCDLGGRDFVRLNEFIPNPGGSDTDLEWVELYNAGSEAFRLDGWTIQTATSEFKDEYTFENGTEIGPGEFLVVGGEDAPEVDFVADGFSIGNGTGGDGLRLVDCEGSAIDTVLYGEELEDDLVGDEGSTEVVPEVQEDVSFARSPDGEDTNSASDWVPCAELTPGAPNCDPAGDGGGDDTGDKPGGGGCCGDSDRPGGGRPATAFVGLVGAAWVLRRKRG